MKAYIICVHIKNVCSRFITLIQMKTLKNGEYQYNEKDFLGEGSFAKVYKGVIVKSQRVVAVRLLSLKLIKQYGNKIKQIISGEVAVLKELAEASNIDYIFTTRIFDCFLTEHNVTMILQFCPDGNLEDIVSKRGPLGEREALEIAYQLARGLQFISKHHVVHRDIKPDNVFIKKEGNHTVYKLGDFGFAVKKQINEEIVGTPIFMSPQLFREQAYGPQVDVWAYGLLVHYLLFKEHYFMEMTEKKVKQKVLETRYTLQKSQLNMISPVTADFLVGCLQFDKNKRLKSQQIAFHPVFNSVKEKIQGLIRDVTNISQLQESRFRKATAKGVYMSKVMSYNFIYDVGVILARKMSLNLASLYLFKYCLSELYLIKSKLSNGQNIIEHSEWNSFIQTPQYGSSLKLVDGLLGQFSKGFERYYNSIIGPISQQHPQVAKGITSNLGNGPYAPINPQIPIYELKTNWIPKLSNSPQDYFVKLQILVVIQLLLNKPLSIDFSSLQILKKSATLQQISEIFEDALKNSQ